MLIENNLQVLNLIYRTVKNHALFNRSIFVKKKEIIRRKFSDLFYLLFISMGGKVSMLHFLSEKAIAGILYSGI